MASNNKNLLTFFKETKDNKVLFTGKYMEVYIPSYYFESNMGEIIEDKVNILGIFLFRIYSSEDKKESAKMNIYKLPSMFTTKPSKMDKVKMNINGEITDFNVLIYYYNDIFIDNTTIIQSATFINQFIMFYNNGKLPNFVDYDDSVKLELEAINIHNMKFPVPSTLLEVMSSEINRDKNDISKSYRFRAAEEGSNKKDYVSISITRIPTFNSTFSSVTFQDIDFQLVSSVNKTKYKREETVSPIEKTIKY